MGHESGPGSFCRGRFFVEQFAAAFSYQADPQ
jgi:hypothetical protein